MSVHSGISLVIPVFNESASISELIRSIKEQTLQPDEIIFVDGGSTDDTVEKITAQTNTDSRYRVIKAGRAYPGKGRNTGAAASKNNWIAFTDAGIRLDRNWLKCMAEKRNEEPACSVIYGNFSPQLGSFFERCAAIAYVPALKPGSIRYRSVVSCLLKKEAWEKVGGFPDWRATEDLVFMEKLDSAGFQSAHAPDSMAWWQLQPGFASTFRKFDLYSMYNVWAGRQAHWHYGVLRHYLLMLVFCLPGFFHHWAWFLGVPAWMLARSVKRIYQHRPEFGIQTLFNPAVIFMVTLITLVTDMATFSGWIKALVRPKPLQVANEEK